MYDGKMNTWPIIESYFNNRHLHQLVRHQIESFDEFINNQIPQTIEMFNPTCVRPEHCYNAELKKYSLEAKIKFVNFQLQRPQIIENNGATKIMHPQEARVRGFTYAGNTTVDIHIQYIVRTGEKLEDVQYFNHVLKQIHIGKMPIMLRSSACILSQHTHLNTHETDECNYDPGGYFIVNGSEKTVLGQERARENKIYIFQPVNNTNKYIYQAEIKTSPDHKRISPKQISMIILYNSHNEHVIQVNIPRIKKPIPLFIVFRALGILSDMEICKIILINFEKNTNMLELLKGSIYESNACFTQEEAVQYISAHAMYTPINMDTHHGNIKKREFTLEILKSDLFSHCKTVEQQIYLLGYMTKKLLLCTTGVIKCDDRDSYLNKRIDLTGTLLNNLFRNYFNKLVKDMTKQIIREMKNGSWKSTDNYTQILNHTNIYKSVKSNTIENGIKRALSTGDFGINKINVKVGVAQVLNRLTYPSILSHLRRINTPIEKSGKMVPPRRLAPSSWGYLCPVETPEGPTVGVVKSLSIMTHVTIFSDSTALYEIIGSKIRPLSEVNDQSTKVFINGCWVGITHDPYPLYLDLKEKKYASIINIYTSIVFDYNNNEIRVCNDAGRLVRPMLKVRNNKLFPIPDEYTWEKLIVNTDTESVIEYIDPDEQNMSMIALSPSKIDPRYKYTHCELHASTIFGILASCSPFSDRNQAPRNTYQCAMAKQAMGVYSTKYHNRLDKNAYVLTYPHKALVKTRITDILKMNDLPSGTTVIVAILSTTGYNQEDSLIFNKGSIDRGLFKTTVFHTEKDEDKKMYGDNEIRCIPDPSNTTGMKFANYGKINSEGLMPENTRIDPMDIIMGKKCPIPVKGTKNDPNVVFKYKDLSKFCREENCYMDKNYRGLNGDGYECWKGRIRSVRDPQIGDKFSSRHGQKGTIGNIMPEEDIPFTENGMRPDIIINPHCITSRMTIGQLLETILGKILVELGMFGDGTSFTEEFTSQKLADWLLKLNFESHGNEILYDGLTGKQLSSDVFIGPIFYQRLKHMVVDKQHSRSIGPMVNLTRQPAEGRARDGGLRFGEMERDCMISHGASKFTKERTYDVSDKYKVHVCKMCGLIAVYNEKLHIHLCKTCNNRTDFVEVKIPYACKLLFQELNTMNIAPRIYT
jgi:DNA-directed RNA polymerase II subunit RPB2